MPVMRMFDLVVVFFGSSDTSSSSSSAMIEVTLVELRIDCVIERVWSSSSAVAGQVLVVV